MAVNQTTILHLSDIHFCPTDQNDFRVVWGAFRDRLDTLASDHGAIDFVCITGDIVKAGDNKDACEEFRDEYLFPLIERLGCYDRIMICPGNHDANRTWVEKNWDSMSEPNLFDADERTPLSLVDLQSEKFKNYLDCFGVLDSKFRVGANPLTPTYFDKEHALGFVCINSALNTFAGVNKKKDVGLLTVDNGALRGALEGSVKPSRWVFLMHHPLNWLEPENADELNRVINEHDALLLHGHMHAGRPSNVLDVFGNSFRHQSGALFTKDKGRYNGFSTIRMVPGHPHIRVDLETYFPIRREFDPAVDIVTKGVFFSSPNAKKFWDDLPVPIHLGALRDWVSSQLLPQLLADFYDPVAQKSLEDIYVEPPLFKQSETEDDLFSSPDETSSVDLDELLASAENVTLVSEREGSRTTLLRIAAMKIARNCTDLQKHFIPAVVSFSSFAQTQRKAMAAVRTALADGLPTTWTVVKLLEHGLCTILVDDFNGFDKAALKTLVEFIRHYPENRFVFSTERQLSTAISLSLQVDLPIPVTAVEVSYLRTSHVRSLIAKWLNVSSADVETLLKKVLEDIVAMNLPMTANNVAILLQLHELPVISRPVNRAALVERYVELLLRKSSLSEIAKGAFDFHNKTHFLGWIAGRMTLSNNYSVSPEWMDTEVRAYGKTFGLDIPGAEWVQQFIHARIFKYEDSLYSFRYRTFLEYFIALAMREDKNVRDFVTGTERYLVFANEIDFYSGLTRNDASLLELVGQRYDELRISVLSETGWTPDLERLGKVSIPRPSEGEGMFREVEEQLDLPPLSDAERDSLADEDMPEDLGMDQRVRRELANADSNKAGQFFNAITLYARLIKNTELVDDAIKRKHLNNVLRGWSEFWIFALGLIPILAKERKVTIGGIDFVVNAPRELSPERLGFELYLAIPVNMTKALHAALGSEKLRLQIEDEGPKADELCITFFKRSLSLDLMTKKAISLAKDAFARFGKNTYLHYAFVAKVRSWWLRSALVGKDHQEVMNMLAKEIAGPGASPRVRNRDATTHAAQLRKRQLFLRMRRQAADD